MHIKKFIDKISAMESKQNKDVVIPMQEARGLRDEVAKLLADLYERNLEKDKIEEVLQVEITGGSFK